MKMRKIFVSLFFVPAILCSNVTNPYTPKRLIVDAAKCVVPTHADNETQVLLKQLCLAPIGTTLDEERCFGDLGCFPMTHPWTSVFRPLPKPMSPDYMDLHVDFYSRDNLTKGQSIPIWPNISMDGIKFDPNRPYTTFIMHGFINSVNMKWIKRMRDSYLNARDANLFLVNWEKASMWLNYLQVASNTRVVGAAVGRFVKYLMEHKGLKIERIHLVGHSLGAQISGYIAKRIPGIPILTAIDPAQPGFEGLHAAVRLDKSDADFVEAIHTSGRPFIPLVGLGFIKPVGHVDFYFNGGAIQPHCADPTQASFRLRSIEDIITIPIEDIALACSHFKACAYYSEAISPENDCKFIARKIGVIGDFTRNVSAGLVNQLVNPVLPSDSPCDAETCTVFGLNSNKYPARGSFAVTTNSESPYCRPEPEQYAHLERAINKTEMETRYSLFGVMEDNPFG